MCYLTRVSSLSLYLGRVFKWVCKQIVMAFSYPKFHGRRDEDIVDFLEKMEVACISNHVEVPAQMLRLLQIFLKGDARLWAKDYEEVLQVFDPPVALSWENLREALGIEFVKDKGS